MSSFCREDIYNENSKISSYDIPTTSKNRVSSITCSFPKNIKNPASKKLAPIYPDSILLHGIQPGAFLQLFPSFSLRDDKARASNPPPLPSLYFSSLSLSLPRILLFVRSSVTHPVAEGRRKEEMKREQKRGKKRETKGEGGGETVGVKDGDDDGAEGRGGMVVDVVFFKLDVEKREGSIG